MRLSRTSHRWQYGERTLHAITIAMTTHSEYEIIIAYPPQQWLNKRVSVLSYMCNVCLVNINNISTKHISVQRSLF
jgi:hypothetical protein